MTLQHGVQFNVSQQPVQQTLERSSTVIGLIQVANTVTAGKVVDPTGFTAPYDGVDTPISLPNGVLSSQLGGTTSKVWKAVDAIRRMVSCPIILVNTLSTNYDNSDLGLEAFLDAEERTGFAPTLIVPLEEDGYTRKSNTDGNIESDAALKGHMEKLQAVAEKLKAYAFAPAPFGSLAAAQLWAGQASIGNRVIGCPPPVNGYLQQGTNQADLTAVSCAALLAGSIARHDELRGIGAPVSGVQTPSFYPGTDWGITMGSPYQDATVNAAELDKVNIMTLVKRNGLSYTWGGDYQIRLCRG